ncbi:Protein of unknown function [Gryllus bimaculatus]|nr:Protein of unknown function [Gryllus bimaculatus]
MKLLAVVAMAVLAILIVLLKIKVLFVLRRESAWAAQLSELLAEEGVGLRSTLRIFIEKLELVYRRSRRRARKRQRASIATNGDQEAPPKDLREVFEELKKIMPAAELQKLYHKKMQESEPFRKFVDLLVGEHGQYK